jgi:hypothetical protein
VHGDGDIGVSRLPMKSLWIPWRGANLVLAPGSPVRLRGARLELVETDDALAVRQEISANDFQPVDPSRRSRCGGPGRWVRSQLRLRLCPSLRIRRVTIFAFAMTSVEGSDLSGGDVGEGTFGRTVRSCRLHCGAWRASSVYTLYARPKGMRGRLRWFTPSRPARGLKTAKIGRGHGGSTQPIRC